MTGWLPRLWQQPSAVLLAVQLIGVLLYPFMDESPIGRAALSTFGLVVLFLAVRAVRATPALLWVAVLLGVPIVVLTILEVVDPLNTQVILWSSVLHAVFYFYTSVALLRYMFLDRFVTTDELWATGATFTVVAWAFAYTFMAVQVIWPGSFTAAIDPGGSADLVPDALPVVHEPDQRRPVRHHARPASRPLVGHDRTGRRPDVRGPGHLADRRADDRPAARLDGKTCDQTKTRWSTSGPFVLRGWRRRPDSNR